MSSVAPTWDLEQLIVAARNYGFQALELRVQWGHAFGLEPDSSSKVDRREARRKLEDAGIAASCVALSSRLAKATDEERQAAIDEIARYAELASDLGSPYLRVFGGPIPQGHSMVELRDRTAEALGKAAARTADLGVMPCLETHDAHNDPADVAYIVSHAGHSNVGVVWHAAHHLRLGISVPAALRQLRPWIRHCHISEQPKAEGAGQPRSSVEPVPLGEGDQNVQEVVRVLKADGFDGVLSWEWINGRFVGGKPSLDTMVDPRPFLAQYGAKLREYVDA